MNLSFDEFLALAKDFNIIPLYQELNADLETPVSAFLKLRSGQNDFLFESVVGGEKWARYSFLGCGLEKEFCFNVGEGAFENLSQMSQDWQPYQDPSLPRFFGGLVGFVSYDMIADFEGLSLKNQKLLEHPDLAFLFCDRVVIFDNLDQVMRIVSVAEINSDSNENDLRVLYDKHCQKIQNWVEVLNRPLERSAEKNLAPIQKKSFIEKQDYMNGVEKIREYIVAGDVFQAVYSQPFLLEPIEQDPFEIYRELRRLNPSPYMYYLNIAGVDIVGASPEILVRIEDGQIQVRPIAGTRPRGKTEAEDLALEKELVKDPKELAEHIMLVDLGRNDLGRVAEKSSVVVEEQKVVERYSHVMHLVSHVSAQLASDHTVFDTIASCFPAGTLSGAPKIRAMEIIEELENTARGIYGGAIGYVSFGHNADLAISIRTAVFQNKKAIVQAGAGIVYDSNPEREFEECLSKAAGMIAAIEGASK